MSTETKCDACGVVIDEQSHLDWVDVKVPITRIPGNRERLELTVCFKFTLIPIASVDICNNCRRLAVAAVVKQWDGV